MQENIVLFMIKVPNFKLESCLSQGSSAAVQKKGYLWEDVEDPSNIEIHHFFHYTDVKFNSGSHETNFNSIRFFSY